MQSMMRKEIVASHTRLARKARQIFILSFFFLKTRAKSAAARLFASLLLSLT